MDNILKYILAVLGLFALVAIAIPSESGSDDKNAVKPAVTPVKTTPKPGAVAPTKPDKSDDADEKSSKSDDWDDEFESFGQPMNDAKPIGLDDSDDSQSKNKGGGSNSPPPGSPAFSQSASTQNGGDTESE
jgi:hypothetical protein